MPELSSLVPECEALGGRLAAKAEALDAFVGGRCYTRIHGDCKAWNLFLGTDGDLKDKVIFIDMQWTGSGHPLQVRL